MTLSSRSYGAARVLSPAGRLDHDNCEAFRADLAPHVESGAHAGETIVLDLSRLEYVSSAGLRCFMLAAKQARSGNGRMVVAAMQPVVGEIFHISRFDLVFEVYPTVRDAIAALSPQAVAAFDRG